MMGRLRRIERYLTIITLTILFVVTFIITPSSKNKTLSLVKKYHRMDNSRKGSEMDKSHSGTETSKSQSGTETSKSQSGTEADKSQSGTETSKSQSGTETDKSQNATEMEKSRTRPQSDKSYTGISAVYVKDRAVRGETNDVKSYDVKSYEIKFIPKEFSCQGTELIRGLVTVSRDLLMCSQKLDEFNKNIVNSNIETIEKTDVAATDKLKYGGFYKPRDCAPTEVTAIIIPYRDRAEHLETLLNHLHPFLQKQNLHYGIYVVEMALPTQFNRGLLINAGFLIARSISAYNCYIIHDVDLLPTNENNFYKCGKGPRHLMAHSTKYKNNGIPYSQYVGGVLAMSPEQFIAVNGFSNFYFGWGGEDDDMYKRITSAGMVLERPPVNIGTYVNLEHAHTGDSSNPPNPHKIMLLSRATTRQYQDGLNSIMFQRQALEFRQTYTRILIQANESEIMADYPSLRANVDLGTGTKTKANRMIEKLKSPAKKMVESKIVPRKVVPQKQEEKQPTKLQPRVQWIRKVEPKKLGSKTIKQTKIAQGNRSL